MLFILFQVFLSFLRWRLRAYALYKRSLLRSSPPTTASKQTQLSEGGTRKLPIAVLNTIAKMIDDDDNDDDDDDDDDKKSHEKCGMQYW